MNVRSRRAVRRVGIGAVALAVSAAVVGTASPAYADDTADLQLASTGGTLTADASGKNSTLKLKNNGPSVPTGVVITMDVHEIITTQVALDTEDCSDKGSGKFDCPIEAADVPQVGATTDFIVRITKKVGAVTGPAGKVTYTVSHAGTDAVAGNNSVSLDVVIGEGDTDLTVIAEDVKNAIKLDGEGFPVIDDDWYVFDGPLTSGGIGLLEYSIVNQGDTALAGAKITAKLPANTVFAFEYDGCTYSDDHRTVTCVRDDLPMIPADEDTDKEDENFRGWNLAFEVAVAAGVTAPVTLSPGSVSAEPIAADAPDIASKRAAVAPKGAQGVSEDVDATDNTDEFVVLVAKKPASGGGTLPITGAKAGLIGGAGAVALVVGVLLFVMARRRRVVLMTPTDL